MMEITIIPTDQISMPRVPAWAFTLRPRTATPTAPAPWPGQPGQRPREAGDLVRKAKGVKVGRFRGVFDGIQPTIVRILMGLSGVSWELAYLIGI